MDLSKRIQECTQQHLLAGTFPGSGVLVVHRGVILYEKTHGYAELFHNGTKLKSPRLFTKQIDTLFDLASLTKVLVTTQLIQILIYHQEINLEDKIAVYLPELKNFGNKITIRHLLNHTSGLPAWQPIYYFADEKPRILQYIDTLKLLSLPGEKSTYSDFSFIILGYIIEKTTQSSLDKYANKTLFQPLGMTHTLYNPLSSYTTEEIAATSFGNPYEKKMAKDFEENFSGHEKLNPFSNWRDYTLIGEVNDGNAFYAMHGVSGHAGLFSSLVDLFHLGELILQKGKSAGKIFYDTTIAETFISTQIPGRALGWEKSNPGYMGKFTHDQVIAHTGFTGTQVIYDCKNHLQIVVLTNKQNNGLQADGKYLSTWPYGKEIANTVYDYLQEHNLLI